MFYVVYTFTKSFGIKLYVSKVIENKEGLSDINLTKEENRIHKFSSEDAAKTVAELMTEKFEHKFEYEARV